MKTLRKLVTPIALVLVTGTSYAWADSDQRPSADRERPDRPNGQFHRAKHKVARIFHALDTDENGIITLDEFLEKPLAKAAGQFDRIDTDNDELISFEEFTAVHHERDRPTDIDVDELRACIAERLDRDLPERPDRASWFAEIDTNGDGFIDFDEFTAAKTAIVTNRFNRIDENADGGITPRELFAAFKKHRERRMIRRECVEEQRDVSDLLEG